MGCGASAKPAEAPAAPAAAPAEAEKPQLPAESAAPAAASQAATEEAETKTEAPAVGIDWAALNAKLPYEKTPEQKKLGAAAAQNLNILCHSLRAKRMQMFKEIDMNHSNKLSLAEVSAAMEKILEEVGQELKVPEVIRMAFNVAKVAAQKHGVKGSEDYVEKVEFRLLLQYTREYFELYQLYIGINSEKGDKYVALEEFKKAVPLLQEWGVTLENPEETFKSMDKNESGKIRFEDFAEWAMNQNLDSPDDDEETQAAEPAAEVAADPAAEAAAEPAAEPEAAAA